MIVNPVYAKLHKVMVGFGRVEKDGTNEAQKYRYLSDAQIKEHMNALLSEHGLLFLVKSAEIVASHGVPDSKQYVTDIRLRYEWVDIETGASVSGEMLGSGSDAMDKGVYKAITGAGKYVAHTTFQLRTKDDPENDGKGPQRPRALPGATTPTRNPANAGAPISEPQRKRLFALMNKAGKSEAEVRQIVANAGYEHTSDILVRDYDAICKEIEA